MPLPVFVRPPAPEPPLAITPENVEAPLSTWAVRVRPVLPSERLTAPDCVAFAMVSV